MFNVALELVTHNQCSSTAMVKMSKQGIAHAYNYTYLLTLCSVGMYVGRLVYFKRCNGR